MLYKSLSGHIKGEQEVMNHKLKVFSVSDKFEKIKYKLGSVSVFLFHTNL